MRKLIAALFAAFLFVAAVPLMTFANGGGQDPALAAPENDNAPDGADN